MSLVTNNPYERLECDTGKFLTEMVGFVEPHEVSVMAPLRNTHHRNDATGAFHPGAARFCRVHGLNPADVYRFDNGLGRYALASAVLDILESDAPKVLVMFSHGYQHGIQCGIRSPGHPRFSDTDARNWRRFADALTTHAHNGFAATTVLLYACSTGDDPQGAPDSAPGSGDGSFADMLRDALCARQATQCRILSHTTAGHAWYNPEVKLFDGDGSPHGGRGAELVARNGDERRKLRELLKTDWAFTFPFRSLEAIRADIS